MIDTLDIESTPYDERCAQVGESDYERRAKLECSVMLAQLGRQFGDPPTGCSIHRKTNPHDFGTYYSLEIWFNEEHEECVDWAFKIEGNMPKNWDEEAKKELAEDEYYVTEY